MKALTDFILEQPINFNLSLFGNSSNSEIYKTLLAIKELTFFINSLEHLDLYFVYDYFVQIFKIHFY